MATETEGIEVVYERYQDAAWQHTVTFKRYLPEGIDTHPTTVPEALIASRAVLDDERKWVTGAWFMNAHPEVDPDDPFCNSWQACAEGAVLMVTVGAMRTSTEVKEGREALHVVDDPGGWTCASSSAADLRDSYLTSCPEGFQDEMKRRQCLYNDTVEQLRSTACDLAGRDFEAAHSYNDANTTTYADVVVWFDKAIEAAQAAEG